MSAFLDQLNIQLLAPGKADDDRKLELQHAIDSTNLKAKVLEFVQGVLQESEATKPIRVVVSNV